MKRLIPVICVVALGACGGGGATTPTAPSTPSTPATVANRNPIINNVTVNPSFGIQDKTIFNFATSASDPDSDALTYSWDIAGRNFSGANVAATFSAGSSGAASVTVADGKGGTANGSQLFVVASATGSWSGTGTDLGAFTMTLTQSNGQISGSYSDTFGPGQVGPTGAPGTIDANGNVELRAKQAPFTDFTFRGTMDATGRRITGGVFGSGFTGESFTMTK